MSDSYLGMLSILLVIADFCLQKGYSKKWTALRNKIPSPLPNLVFTPLSYSGIIRVKMFVLKHWIFFEYISSFKKQKSLIIDKKCWMLQNAMLRETIIFLPKWQAWKMQKKQEVRRKNQTSFFSKLLGQQFKSYLLWKNIIFQKFCRRIYIE